MYIECVAYRMFSQRKHREYGVSKSGVEAEKKNKNNLYWLAAKMHSTRSRSLISFSLSFAPRFALNATSGAQPESEKEGEWDGKAFEKLYTRREWTKNNIKCFTFLAHDYIIIYIHSWRPRLFFRLKSFLFRIYGSNRYSHCYHLWMRWQRAGASKRANERAFNSN